MRTLPKLFLIGLALVLAWTGFWFFQQTGFHKPSETVTYVQLKENAPFKIKKRSEVLQHEVFRIASTRQPQEFLVLNRIDPKLIDPVFGKTPNLPFVNTIANQLLASATRSDEGRQGHTVEIQEVKTLKNDVIEVNGRRVPYWEVRVKFKLSNEDYPREYEAALIRQPDGEGQEVLTVSYAQENVFDKALIADLVNSIHLEEMK